MNLLEALRYCKSGWRVRPLIWQSLNPGHWVEARTHGKHSVDGPSTRSTVFVENGSCEEMAHALRLQFETELLGEWEVLETPRQGNVPRPAVPPMPPRPKPPAPVIFDRSAPQSAGKESS